jgi:hypothetical protein
MTYASDVNARDELRDKAEKITDLTMLVQQFPKEARLILDAVEDGLTLGPAQIMDDSHGLDDDEKTEEATSSAGADSDYTS